MRHDFINNMSRDVNWEEITIANALEEDEAHGESDEEYIKRLQKYIRRLIRTVLIMGAIIAAFVLTKLI